MSRLERSAGQIDIWHLSPETAADARILEECRSWLSPDERLRLQRITHAESRQLFLLGRAMLRRALSHYSGYKAEELVFQYNAYGKPSLKTPNDPPLEFSVSHTRGLVACAVVLGAPLGIDVERNRTIDNPLEIAKRIFAPAETAALEAVPAERLSDAFLDLWTLREAFVKARGAGMMTSRAEFAFSVATHRKKTDAIAAQACTIPDQGANWQFLKLWPTDGHRAALAIRKPRSEKLEIVLRQAFADA